MRKASDNFVSIVSEFYLKLLERVKAKIAKMGLYSEFLPRHWLLYENTKFASPSTVFGHQLLLPIRRPQKEGMTFSFKEEVIAETVGVYGSFR